MNTSTQSNPSTQSTCPTCNRPFKSIQDFPFVHVSNVVINSHDFIADLSEYGGYVRIEDADENITSQLPNMYDSVVVNGKIYTRTSPRVIKISENSRDELINVVQEVNNDLRLWKELENQTVPTKRLPLASSDNYEKGLHLNDVDSSRGMYALALVRKSGEIGLNTVYSNLCILGRVELKGMVCMN